MLYLASPRKAALEHSLTLPKMAAKEEGESGGGLGLHGPYSMYSNESEDAIAGLLAASGTTAFTPYVVLLS